MAKKTTAKKTTKRRVSKNISQGQVHIKTSLTIQLLPLQTQMAMSFLGAAAGNLDLKVPRKALHLLHNHA